MNRERWIVAHAAATWYMTGVIWMVQWVHYPLFANVGDDAFVAYQRAHTSGMTPVVLPAMLVELIAAALLASGRVPVRGRTLARIGFALVLATWGSTFLVQVPLHERLLNGFDADTHAGLVASNWFRTVLWTTRGLLAGVLLADELRNPRESRES